MRWQSLFALLLVLWRQSVYAGARFEAQAVAGRPWRRIVIGSFFLGSDLGPSKLPYTAVAGMSASVEISSTVMENGQTVIRSAQAPLIRELMFHSAESPTSPFSIQISMEDAALLSFFNIGASTAVHWGEAPRAFWFEPDLGVNELAGVRSALWDGMAFGLFPAHDAGSALARIYAVRDLAPPYLVREGQSVSDLFEMLLELGISKNAFSRQIGFTGKHPARSPSSWTIIPPNRIGRINQELDILERTGIRYSDVDIAIKEAKTSRKAIGRHLLRTGVTTNYDAVNHMFRMHKLRGRFGRSLYVPREGGKWEALFHEILGEHLPYRSGP